VDDLFHDVAGVPLAGQPFGSLVAQLLQDADGLGILPQRDVGLGDVEAVAGGVLAYRRPGRGQPGRDIEVACGLSWMLALSALATKTVTGPNTCHGA
jgi:hypothetical protein